MWTDEPLRWTIIQTDKPERQTYNIQILTDHVDRRTSQMDNQIDRQTYKQKLTAHVDRCTIQMNNQIDRQTRQIDILTNTYCSCGQMNQLDGQSLFSCRLLSFALSSSSLKIRNYFNMLSPQRPLCPLVGRFCQEYRTSNLIFQI